MQRITPPPGPCVPCKLLDRIRRAQHSVVAMRAERPLLEDDLTEVLVLLGCYELQMERRVDRAGRNRPAEALLENATITIQPKEESK